jgi:hypothetical protein
VGESREAASKTRPAAPHRSSDGAQEGPVPTARFINLDRKRKPLRETLDLTPRPSHANALPAVIDLLHELRRHQGSAEAQKAVRTKDEVIRLRSSGREERRLDLADSTVACDDGEAGA